MAHEGLSLNSWYWRCTPNALLPLLPGSPGSASKLLLPVSVPLGGVGWWNNRSRVSAACGAQVGASAAVPAG